MSSHSLRRRPLLSVLAVTLLAAALEPSQAGSAGNRQGDSSAVRARLLAHVQPKPMEDRIPEDARRSVEAAISQYERAGMALAAPKADLVYPFYPQAGILGQDLYIVNFTDQDPSANIRDWDCTGYTYDGHRGHDSMIRSFREQAIGVPIFAALDGRVVDAHDGEPDMSTRWVDVPANYVVLDHGGGYYAYYWHMKRGSVAVRVNQTVTAGTQIGLTGSSGFSSGPHLHFESWKDGQWFEPSGGRCRAGDSYWKDQPAVTRDFYIADAYLSKEAMPTSGDLEILLDPTPRAATFLTGTRQIFMRMDYRNLPGGSTWRLRAINPAGATSFDEEGSWGNSFFYRMGYGFFVAEGNFTPGRWRLLLDINDATVLDAPFTIVPKPSQVVNRRPNPIRVRLEPAAPAAGQIMTCQVQTSLIYEDPDFDLIRYTYVWKIKNRVVRTVTSAALSDVLAKGKTRPGDRVSCRVTAADVRGGAARSVAAVNVETEPAGPAL